MAINSVTRWETHTRGRPTFNRTYDQETGDDYARRKNIYFNTPLLDTSTSITYRNTIPRAADFHKRRQRREKDIRCTELQAGFILLSMLLVTTSWLSAVIKILFFSFHAQHIFWKRAVYSLRFRGNRDLGRFRKSSPQAKFESPEWHQATALNSHRSIDTQKKKKLMGMVWWPFDNLKICICALESDPNQSRHGCYIDLKN